MSIAFEGMLITCLAQKISNRVNQRFDKRTDDLLNPAIDMFVDKIIYAVVFAFNFIGLLFQLLAKKIPMNHCLSLESILSPPITQIGEAEKEIYNENLDQKDPGAAGEEEDTFLVPQIEGQSHPNLDTLQKIRLS